MNPFITIIIPSLGRNSLDQAIESICNQETSQKWETIIVYDRSVEQIIEHRDFRIRSFYPEISGDQGALRNVGIAFARTKWIGFLDDDDTLTSDYVETIFNASHLFDVVRFWPTGASKLDLEIFRARGTYAYVAGITWAAKRDILFKNPFDTDGFGEDVRLIERLYHNPDINVGTIGNQLYNVKDSMKEKLLVPNGRLETKVIKWQE